MQPASSAMQAAADLFKGFLDSSAQASWKGLSDSDHAGCKVSRKSTSDTVLMLGQHLIKFSSTTQGVLSLSSVKQFALVLVETIPDPRLHPV